MSTDFAALPATLSVGDDSVRATLANVLTAPATGAATTIMLDRSLNLAPVVNALDRQDQRPGAQRGGRPDHVRRPRRHQPGGARPAER